MIKTKYFETIKEFFTSSRVLKAIYLLTFALILTVIISSQNFFFQNIIENGISKKEIIAQKTITVEDVKRTEARRREVAQKVEPILVPAEDEFIKTNLETLENSVYQIRKKSIPESEKVSEINVLFDLSDLSVKEKNFVVGFLLSVDDATLKEVFDKASLSLANVLNVGISESDYDNNKVKEIIMKNLVNNVSRRQIVVISALLGQVIVPNLVVDDTATELAKINAQDAVKPYMVTFHAGDKIVFEGEPITKLKKDALREAGYNVYELNRKGLCSVFLLVLLICATFISYLKSFERKFLEPRYLALAGFLAITTCAIGVLLPVGFSPYVIPIPAVIILASIFLNPRTAFLLSILILAVMSTGLQYKASVLIVFTLLALIGTITISRIKFTRRFDLIKLGFKLGAAGVLIMLCLYLIDKCLIEISNYLILKNCVYIFTNALISSILSLGVLPLFESTFNIITPYGLSELGDHNQPLLKRLQLEAPGTYHHSLMVSTLCEAAAEAIGANPILARVGAFYHDIGKLKRPLFFVENQSYFGIAENPHNNLTPRLSKMVITSHPKDGVEIAKEYGLPNVICDFIIQHHGNGLAKYFYNQAIEEEGAENVKEEQFRYNCPKPNTKETAILMLADAVESAVRAMKGATPEEIDQIINKIIVERLNDGQLEESPLTLKDLKVIASTFSRVLRGMQHNRIKYQDNIAEEFNKNKIEIPQSTIIDKDLENKVKELKTSAKTQAPTDKPDDSKSA